ncbi:MAG: peptidyl-prolyl cis-trans isomerase [Gemmatimonadota bacterium]|nr:peptidyl-prolyl cis-trans isomerase [Gemmatimonadota bacterium]
MKRIALCALALTVVSANLLANQGAAAPAQPQSVVLQRVLVKVNGAIFTKTELEELQIEELRTQQKRQLSQMDLLTDAKLREELIKITPEILANAVDDLILIQRGRELGLRMTDAIFKEYVENIKKENQFDDATFKQALAQQGMNMEQLRSNVEKVYLKQGVMRRDVEPRISITEEEARQYYRAHPGEFMKPTMITVREISVLVPSEARSGEQVVNVAVDEAALEKLKSARARALKGEDFAALVTEISQSGSKANGGLIGPLNLAELAEGLQKVLAPLKTGDIAEPIRTPVGYQLLKVELKDEATVQPFEAVRNDVSMKVQQERGQAEMQKFVDSLRGQAIIEWKDEELRKMYEQFRAQQKKAS